MTPDGAPARLLGGRYRIDALLGRGGMSEVHHGYDERLDRPVAIKTMRPTARVVPADGPEAEEARAEVDRNRVRFIREIRTTARLEHPGIPAVYDTGAEEQPDGSSRIWLVMQLIRGSTLEGLLEQADFADDPPAVSWAAAIAAQIAAVLADVHRQDIIHRDIKPANVMIVDGGLIKILDFGIAILRGASSLPRLTQVDRTVGTPPYMSPEQHLGRVVTAASDIYSLGCLLYELLVGDPPFLETPTMPLRALHVQAPVPSARAARPDVPEPLDELVRGMLVKDPTVRPTAEQVYRSLVPFVGGGTRDVAVPDDRDPARPFRTPLLTPPARSEQASAGAPLTEGEFEQILAGAGTLLEAGNGADAVRLLESGFARAGTNPFFELELRYLLGTAQFFVGEYRRAATLLSDACRKYRAEGLPPSHPRIVTSAYQAGHAYVEIGEPRSALSQLRFYLQIVDQDDPGNAEQILQTRFVVAQLLATEGDPAEALAELEALRPAFLARYGSKSLHLRNLDRQISGLRPQ